MGGAPGVLSARYAGAEASDEQRMQKLLQELAATGSEDRNASFYCALAYMRHAVDPTPILAVGQWHGVILQAPIGTDGFGYDPIFGVPTHGCSAAQLDSTEKNKISHRGIAMQQFVAKLAQEVR